MINATTPAPPTAIAKATVFPGDGTTSCTALKRDNGIALRCPFTSPTTVSPVKRASVMRMTE